MRSHTYYRFQSPIHKIFANSKIFLCKTGIPSTYALYTYRGVQALQFMNMIALDEKKCGCRWSIDQHAQTNKQTKTSTEQFNNDARKISDKYF